jgi:Fe-S cluster biogenesis protein NfuA
MRLTDLFGNGTRSLISPEKEFFQMVIFVEPTPNPRTKKFLPGFSISPVPLDFVTAPADDPLLQEIFDIYGVTGIHVGDVFIAVTVEDPSMWPDAINSVTSALKEGLKTFNSSKYHTEKSANNVTDQDTEIVTRIKDVIETYVRPSVANDGGDIVFGSFDENTGLLRLSMRGACSGCPSSTATLKLGIQNLMSHFAPEVRAIESF